MHTEKLYYEDCHRSAFTAQVLACRRAGEQWEVILDRTAFYPEGGGQAADTGSLGAVRVLHTREEREAVCHVCDGPLEAGSRVEGRIDWELRFHRMQQHTGEHILSGLVHSRWGYHNTGFHMGADGITVDFDGVIPPRELPGLEEQCNRAVWANAAVRCWVPSPRELETVFYRTKKPLPWPVRLVEITGYDTCACCGIHTAGSGEVGLIKLFSSVPFRGGSRLTMACGGHALRIMNEVYLQNQQVSQALSVPMGQTGAGVARLLDQLADRKYRLAALQRERLAALAEQYRGKGDVLCITEGLDGALLRELTERIEQVCGGRAAVFSLGEDGSFGYCVITGDSDLRAFGKALNAALHGRGGGKPRCIQGRVAAREEDIRAFFRTADDAPV